MSARALWIAMGLFAVMVSSPAAFGQQESSEQAVLMTADDLSFDEDIGTATARGNVEIVQGERILNADAVTYNQRDDIVTATGNVVLLEPTGEVLFAEFAELTSDMREGFLRGFRMLLNDDSRLAAVSAQRRGGVETELTRAVYSPCRNCLGFDDEPLWQIKARRVVHNAEEQEVVYRDATLELLGVPIAYTPYLSHPDPTVQRKSGILTPTFGTSSLLGSNIQVPYFWAISDESDLTFDPILSTDQLPVVTGEYRERFASGENRTRLSFTNDDAQTDADRFRGHIDSETRFSIDELWRWGADIRLASDDTYLGRYGFRSDNTLTNRLYVEGFGSRSHAVAEALYFQGLNDEDNQEDTPVVAPNLEYSYISTPGDFGEMTTLDANLRALTREVGATSQRVSLTPGWQISHTDSLGSITSFRASLQGDLYNVNVAEADNDRDNNVVGRVFPQAIVSWRYPWVRRSGTNSQIIEPLLALVVAPNGGNPEDIPDEDSQSIAFDETNLFDANRFSGTDRVEGGQRLVYGIRTGVFGELGGASTLTVGQSIRFRESNPFPSGTGLEDQFSDIVANLQITPNRFMSLLHKTRFDHDSLRARRTEIAASVGPPALNVDLNYVFFDRTSGFPDREEVTASLQSKLTEQWSAQMETRRDLTADGGTLSYGAALVYECDCMNFELVYNRTFTTNRNIPRVESLTFRITFKSLGQIESSVL